MKSIVFALAAAYLMYQCVSMKVSVYYESLCSDSIEFLTRQLYPNFEDLKENLDIELVPYGKAAHSLVDGAWRFACQHGPSECKGNQFQSCALFHTKDPRTKLKFVNCVMKLRNPTGLTHMENCAKVHELDLPRISRCFTSKEGGDLLATNGEKTWKVDTISFIPTILFEGVYDEEVQAQSLKDFAAAVCSKMNGTKPKVCDAKRSPTT